MVVHIPKEMSDNTVISVKRRCTGEVRAITAAAMGRVDAHLRTHGVDNGVSDLALLAAECPLHERLSNGMTVGEFATSFVLSVTTRRVNVPS